MADENVAGNTGAIDPSNMNSDQLKEAVIAENEKGQSEANTANATEVKPPVEDKAKTQEIFDPAKSYTELKKQYDGLRSLHDKKYGELLKQFSQLQESLKKPDDGQPTVDPLDGLEEDLKVRGVVALTDRIREMKKQAVEEAKAQMATQLNPLAEMQVDSIMKSRVEAARKEFADFKDYEPKIQEYIQRVIDGDPEMDGVDLNHPKAFITLYKMAAFENIPELIKKASEKTQETTAADTAANIQGKQKLALNTGGKSAPADFSKMTSKDLKAYALEEMKADYQRQGLA